MYLGSCSVKNLNNNLSTSSWFASSHFCAWTRASCPNFFRICRVAVPTCLASSWASWMTIFALAAIFGITSLKIIWTFVLIGATMALILFLILSNSSEILSAKFAPDAWTFSIAVSMASPTLFQKSVKPLERPAMDASMIFGNISVKNLNRSFSTSSWFSSSHFFASTKPSWASFFTISIVAWPTWTARSFASFKTSFAAAISLGTTSLKIRSTLAFIGATIWLILSAILPNSALILSANRPPATFTVSTAFLIADPTLPQKSVQPLNGWTEVLSDMFSMIIFGSCSVKNLNRSSSTNSWFFSSHFWASNNASCPSFFSISNVAKPTCFASSLASEMINFAFCANTGIISCITTWTLALTGAIIEFILSFNSSNSSDILSDNFSPVALTFSTALSIAFPTFSQKSDHP